MRSRALAIVALACAGAVLMGCGGTRGRSHNSSGPSALEDSDSPEATFGALDPRVSAALRQPRSLRAATFMAESVSSIESVLFRSVAFDLVPEVLLQITRDTFPGANIEHVGVGAHPERGVFYAVEFRTVDDRACEVFFLEDGVLFSQRCRAADTTVAAPVREAVEAEVFRATIQSVDQVRHEGKEELWVEVFDGEKNHRVVLDAEGQVVRHLVWVPARLGISLDE